MKNFYIVLPDRYTKLYTTETQLDVLNRIPLDLCYRGKTPGKYGRVMIDFRQQHDGQAFDDDEGDVEVEADAPPDVPHSSDDDDDTDVEITTPPVVLVATATTTTAATTRGKRSADDTTLNTYPSKKIR